MSQPFNLSEIADKVESVLINTPESRDDDRLLLAAVWLKEQHEMEDNRGFFVEFVDRRLSNPESITRARRKLQQNNPMLRGERWEDRHDLEPVIVSELQSI